LWDFDRGEKLFEEFNASKAIPTYHDKIMIAEEIQDEYEQHRYRGWLDKRILKMTAGCKDEKNCPRI
jgi:cobalamin biosynthesis protein CobT